MDCLYLYQNKIMTVNLCKIYIRVFGVGVKYGICEKIFAIEKIPMQVSVHLYSRPSRVSFIMLPFSIVAIHLPPHFPQNGPK